MKHISHYIKERAKKLAEQHEVPVCPYCGEPKDADDILDDMVLCKECREDFGHTTIDEL